jgi:hypothetical protein
MPTRRTSALESSKPAPTAEDEGRFPLSRSHASRLEGWDDGHALMAVTVSRKGAEAEPTATAKRPCCLWRLFLLWSKERVKGVPMEVAIHLPEDVAAAVPWEDVPRHLLEQIALEGYGEGWLSEEQVRRLLGYETRLDVHGFLKDHGVYLRYTVEDLERDRATHERLGL